MAHKKETVKEGYNLRNLKLGIDLGSEYIRAIVTDGEKFIKKYSVRSNGIEGGTIYDFELAREAVTRLCFDIYKDYKRFPEYIGIVTGSVNISYSFITVSHITKRPNGIISNIDIEDIEREALKKVNNLSGKSIIYRKIIKYVIDGKEVIGDINGIYGKRIDARVIFVYDDVRQIEFIYNLFKSLELDIDVVVPGVLADAAAVLSKRDRKLGAISLNIGAQTSSYIYYENNRPIVMGIFPYGGENLTSEIALMLRVNMDEAEVYKKDLLARKESGKDKKIAELLLQKVSDIARGLDIEMSKIERSGLIPGGITITGGTSRLSSIEDIFKYEMKIPVNSSFKNFKELDVAYESKEESTQISDLSEYYYNDSLSISDPVYTRSYGVTKFIESFGEVDAYNRFFHMYFDKVKSFFVKLLP